MIEVIKKKPLILTIFPVIFVIEWLLNPLITNMPLNHYYGFANEIKLEYSMLVRFVTIPYIIRSIFVHIILSLVIMMFYRGFFLKKEMRNNFLKDFIKTIFAGILVYIFCLIMWTLLNDLVLFVYYRIGSFTNTIISITFNFITTWLPILFACFLFSYAISCVQNGFGLFETCKKTLRVIFTKNVFFILLMAVIATCAFLVVANLEFNENKYERPFSEKFEEMMSRLEENNLDSSQKENASTVYEKYEEILKGKLESNESYDYDKILDDYYTGNSSYDLFNDSPIEFFEPQRQMTKNLLFLSILKIVLRSIFISFIFVFSAAIASKSKDLVIEEQTVEEITV